MDISVVVPLYNEEDNVQLLYEEIKGVLDTMAEQAEIVFVDDGSRDNTLAKLEAIQAAQKAKGEKAKPALRDVVLQRAIDFITTISLYEKKPGKK